MDLFFVKLLFTSNSILSFHLLTNFLPFLFKVTQPTMLEFHQTSVILVSKVFTVSMDYMAFIIDPRLGKLTPDKKERKRRLKQNQQFPNPRLSLPTFTPWMALRRQQSQTIIPKRKHSGQKLPNGKCHYLVLTHFLSLYHL